MQLQLSKSTFISQFTDNVSLILVFFFFNDTATTEIYTLSLHDALPIYRLTHRAGPAPPAIRVPNDEPHRQKADRKSTRLNSSHVAISYAVFCLKKKKDTNRDP